MANRNASNNRTQDPPEHVLIACGGTGGHLFPGIAVAEALKAKGHDVTLLISEKKIDSLASSGHADLKFEKMPFIAMPRPWSPKMVPFLLNAWRGLKQCRTLIRERKITAVLGMGGFTSTAPVMAGRKEKIRTLIHDSNAIPGKANRFTARYSDLVLLGFKECAKFFPKQDTKVTGTPVRTALREAAKNSKEDPRAFFGLKPGMPVLLIAGGSQGAQGVNHAVMHSLTKLDTLGIQLLHITGPADYQSVRDAYQGKPIELRSHVGAFCHRMELAYRAADVALVRSGASTLAELAYFGVPSILVPYPFAADDHQTRNAEIFTKAGASIMMPQSELSEDTLTATVRNLLKDNKKKQSMKKAARALSHDNAAQLIANLAAGTALNKKRH